MKLLIVGGSGLVGGNLATHVTNAYPSWSVTATHRSHGTPFTIPFDPCLPFTTWPDEIVEGFFDYIIHTGALTHVDRCEDEPELSYLQTVVSTKNLVDFAKKINSRFVYISTDYVFDGANGPYREQDLVNPLSVYGKHKLLSEEYIRQKLSHDNYLITRVTNVYGDELRSKNYITRTIEQIKGGERSFIGPYDQFATPINARDIARCISLLMTGNKNGIYHLASTDYMSRIQLLQTISKVLHEPIEIESVSTKQLGQTAPRPLQAGLLASKFITEYPSFHFSNIDDYIKQTLQW